jgi:hypothetical protein
MKSFSYIVLVTALSLTCLTGCGEAVVIGEGAPDERCGLAPQATIELLIEQSHSTWTARNIQENCMALYQEHVQKLLAEGQCDEITCPEQIKGEAHKCSYDYAVAVNKPTVTRCDAQVLLVPAGVLPEEYVMNFAQDVDTDGDGVSNFDEYVGGSDPCTANSLDVCQSDGDLDYDHDGLSNDSDPAPTCPGTNEIPCI